MKLEFLIEQMIIDEQRNGVWDFNKLTLLEHIKELAKLNDLSFKLDRIKTK